MKGAVAAFSSPAISLWPYKLITGLLARLVDLGATLYTNTPVHAVQGTPSSPSVPGTPVTISTCKGVVRATKVIYATNGYVAGLLPQYRGVIVPIIGQNSRIVPNEATRQRVPSVGHTYNFHYTGAWADYLNPRPDGAIIHGGGGRSFRKDPADRSRTWFNTVDESALISDQVTDDFQKFDQEHFYGWEDSESRVDSAWTGGKSALCRLHCCRKRKGTGLFFFLLLPSSSNFSSF